VSQDVTPPQASSSGAAVDVSDRAGRLLGVASITGTVDPSDRAGRLLGIIASIAAAVDVSDRAGRLLGVVASIASPVDVSDRAGRLLGVVSVSGTPNEPIADQGQATTAAAAAQAPAIAAVAGVTGYLTGFSVDGLGATAASVIELTITGLLGGTKRYKLAIPAGVAVAITRLVVEFATPVAASAANTAITLNVPSFGAGNTSAVAELHGFRR
jgi:hypothetical protein